MREGGGCGRVSELKRDQVMTLCFVRALKNARKLQSAAHTRDLLAVGDPLLFQTGASPLTCSAAVS